MLAQQSQHQIQDKAEETVTYSENKVDSLIEHRQLLTRHLITTLIALNEVNKELENLLLLKTGRLWNENLHPTSKKYHVLVLPL